MIHKNILFGAIFGSLTFFLSPTFSLASDITIVSNETTTVNSNPASVLSFIHSAWTADLDGDLGNAKWIWATDGPTDPTNDQTYVFEKTFTLLNAVASSTLYFAVDNRATVTLNGNIIAVSSSTGFTKETEGMYDIPSSYFIIGQNKLSITATNEGLWYNNNAWNNPAGILYKLVIHESDIVMPTLASSIVTEDDGINDMKGVADKTNFTFNVLYTGATAPSDMTLWTNANDTIHSYPLTISATTTGSASSPQANDGDFTNGEWYTFTGTFPKGHYGYYFEANGGAQRFPESGELTFTTGYSNVAFLPGLEASRLYYNNTNCALLPTCDNTRLWEPNWNADAQKLYLNADGSSIDSTVSTKDPIDTIYGVLGNIYGWFIGSMDDLKTAKTIQDWKPLPYDWRLGFDEILSKGSLLPNGNISYLLGSSTPYIIQETERLAHESDTGKVTIIGHSMGGLVAKKLTNKLKEKGEGNIVDKIILVASPQTGAPIAIGALLHGEDQDQGKGFVLNEVTARTLAENMQSAYNLLPTDKYFTDVFDKVITFDTATTKTLSYRNIYGTTIDDTTELYNFLLGTEARTKPNPQETWLPNVLNKTVYDRSLTEQSELANWTPPEGVEVIQIAGWGATTVSGIKYVERKCHWYETCTTRLDIEPIKIIDGDGTVPVPSALGMNGATNYYVNLAITSGEHKNILEVKSLQGLISGFIADQTLNMPGIVTSVPFTADVHRLNFSVHSPVSIDLYDLLGRHTGLASTSSDSDIQKIDEEIPNSYYFTFGEGKYAGSETESSTTVKLTGLTAGSFTFDVEETQGNDIVASTTFADIPVTASTTATLVITDLATPPVLNMDINGDGVVDAVVSSGDGISTEELMDILHGIIKTLDLPKKKQQNLEKQIDKLEKALEKEYKKEHKKKCRTSILFKNVLKEINTLGKKKLISGDEVAQLTEIIEKIQESVVS
jgi:pimeloyl-ACP methyl ester carboxylesterase